MYKCDFNAIIASAVSLPCALLVIHILLPPEFQVVLDSTQYHSGLDQWNVRGRAIWGTGGNIRSQYHKAPVWWTSEFTLTLKDERGTLDKNMVRKALDRKDLWKQSELRMSGLTLLWYIISWAVIGALVGICIQQLLKWVRARMPEV